jgi:hypothetical protein
LAGPQPLRGALAHWRAVPAARTADWRRCQCEQPLLETLQQFRGASSFDHLRLRKSITQALTLWIPAHRA